MAVSSNMAHLSDTLFTTAIATYAVAMIGYTAEYAFGRRGRVATTSTAVSAPAEPRVLAGAGGPDAVEPPSSGSAGQPPSAEPPVTASGVARRSIGDRCGRFAVAITVLGALIHAASIAVRGVAVDEVPWSNMYEFASVAGLVAVLAFLGALWRMPKIRYLGLFIMFPVIVMMFLAGTVLYARAQPLVPALRSYWLAIHVTAAATAEGALLTSSAITILFLVKQRWDRNVSAARTSRFPVTLGGRLPDAQTLDKVAYRIVAFAFPIYTFGIICGAIWAEAAWGRYWGWDPKETWAFIVWVVYAAYLHARATAGWKGRAAAWINLAGFAAITFNFFVVNIVISGLHSYAGIN